jgi:hypothetical protein
MINKDKFFEEFRPFYKSKTGKTKLTASVVSAVDFLLDAFEEYKWKDIRHVAYALATIAHETAWTFKPIKEYRGKVLTSNQKKYWNTGFYGRGYVQLTWDYNYEKAGKKLGIDLANNPDKALEPEVAIQILMHGMQEGWFTGKKLSDYINSKTKDYVNARRIINGTDKASLIAGYAKAFEKMLLDSFDSTAKPFVQVPKEEPKGEPIDEPVDNYPEEPKPGEPATDEPAKAGEPIAGGRPGDPPKEIESVQPQSTSGLGAWVANIRAQWAALGVSLASLGSVFSGLVTNPIFVYILIGVVTIAILAGVFIYIKSMDIKSKEKMEREQRAHELTKLQVNVNADPTKYNVKVVN